MRDTELRCNSFDEVHTQFLEVFFIAANPKGPNTSLEGALVWFLGVKPLLRRYLDP